MLSWGRKVITFQRDTHSLKATLQTSEVWFRSTLVSVFITVWIWVKGGNGQKIKLTSISLKSLVIDHIHLMKLQWNLTGLKVSSTPNHDPRAITIPIKFLQPSSGKILRGGILMIYKAVQREGLKIS